MPLYNMIERVFKASYARSFYDTPSITARKYFVYAIAAGHYDCVEDYKIVRSDYNSYLLLYTLSGQGYLVYEGKSYTLSPGQVFFINCNRLHEYGVRGGKHWEFKWVHFNGNGCAGYYSYLHETLGPVVTMKEENNLDNYLSLIIDELEERNFLMEITMPSLILELLTEMINPYFNANLSPSEKPGVRADIARCIDYIERHYREHLSIHELAAWSGYSKYHFLRLFKANTGTTPYEYLIRHRLRESKPLLRCTDMAIEEIAVSVGFCSASVFTQHFKKYESITPSQFRAYWKNG